MRRGDFLRDNKWQTIVSIFGILVTIFVAYNIFFLEKEVKSLQAVILANTSLVEIEPTVANDIEILYKEQPISNLTLIQVKLENDGNQSIRKEDYTEPIEFIFSQNAQIVDAAVIETDPPYIDVDISTKQNVVTLSPLLLNEKDRIIIRFFIINVSSLDSTQPFIIKARIVGVQNVTVINAICAIF